LSALTKLFVVLLVISSLLLTAATVVFVNRVEDYRKWAEAEKVRAALKQTEIDSLKVDLVAAQGQIAKLASEATAKAAELQRIINDKDAAAAAKDAQIQTLNAQISGHLANIATLTAANEQAQKLIKDLKDRNEVLVQEEGKLRLVNADLVAANTDYQKRLDEAEKERRWLVEQVNQLRAEVTRLTNILVENRIQLTSSPPRRRSAPELKGVVKAVKTDGGITYVTITLGAADKVEKGMQFRVINQFSNEFLGNLTIESVDQNEAFGRVEGPKLADIKPDHEVRSQW